MEIKLFSSLSKGVSFSLCVFVILFLTATSIYIYILQSKLDSALTELASAKVELSYSRLAVGALTTTLEMQNRSIEKLHLDISDKITEHKAKMIETAKLATVHKESATRIIISRPVSSDCVAVDRMINEEITRNN